MALADTILSKASHMRADRVGGDVQAGRWHAVRTDSPVRWRCPRWTVLRRPDRLVLPAPDYLASHRTILRCYARLLRCYIRLSCDEDGSELYHSCPYVCMLQVLDMGLGMGLVEFERRGL
jgi:hypothetical protein